MRCSVLGGSGFVGRHLGQHLRSMDHDVYVPDRSVSFKGMDLGNVFYCIGLTADFRTRPFDTVRAHIERLSELLEHATFDSLLYLSSTRIYLNGNSSFEEGSISANPTIKDDLYNISKAMGESLCLSSGRPNVRIARLSNVVGSGMGYDNFLGMLIREAMAGSIKLESHPLCAKDYVLVRDVVKLLELIAKSGKRNIYNIAGGVNISHGEIVDFLSASFGCDVIVDESSKIEISPKIEINRIRDEFNYDPGSLLDSLHDVVESFYK